MAIEIRELVIRAAMTSQETQQTAGSSSAPAPADNTEQLLAECADAVMKIIRDKNER